jgi:transposase
MGALMVMVGRGPAKAELVLSGEERATLDRLNRGGDRQLNRALHTIILSRLKHDPRTADYAAHAMLQGKTRRETIRCLKRYFARHLYRLLEHNPVPTPDATMIGPCS